MNHEDLTAAIANVVTYNWDRELRDYLEVGEEISGTHIIHDLYALAQFAGIKLPDVPEEIKE